MKPIVKRITVYILAVMLTLTMTPAYAFAGEEAEDGTTVSNLLFNEETISEEGAAADNDELFMQYVEAKLSEGIENEESGEIPGHARMRRVMPSGINAAIYASLKEQVKLVADGKKTSAVFEVTLEELVLEKNGWTAEELGVPAIAVNGRITQEAKNALTKELGINMRSVLTALLFDCPYDLYWYDKERGVSISGPGISAERGESGWEIFVTSGITVSFEVADGYSTGNDNEVDPSKAERVEGAVNNAKAIVREAEGETDHGKLVSYKEAICSLVEYDQEAAADTSMPYGDPWQVISVFDEDVTTNVVCEGYSKAFQYLCDLTDFESDLDCISVSGTMSGGTGSGAHMWNILCMGDGKNYLADITNCDEGTVGSPDKLFIAGYAGGDVSSGYTFSCIGGTIKYYYDSETTSAFDEELIIAPKGSCPHDLIRSEEIPATCTVDGVREYWTCTMCEGLFGDANATETLKQADIIIPAGHKEEVMPAMAATCTETGLTEGLRCSVCGDILIAQEVVPAKGHDWDEWTLIREATAKEEGLKTRTCKRDASHIEEQVIPKVITVIIIGDSFGETSYGGIRDGVEIDPAERNGGWANCWTGRLASKLELSDNLVKTVLSEETGHQMNFFDNHAIYSASGRSFCAAVSGTDFTTMTTEISSYVDTSKVSLIILGGGTNDTKFYNQTSFRTKTSQLIETAHSIYPNAKIVLAQIGWGKYSEGTLPEDYVPYGEWDDKIQARVEYLDADLRAVCDRYDYAFYTGNIAKDVLAGKEDEYFTGKLSNGQYDPTHPNYLGEEALASEVYERTVETDISDLCENYLGHNLTGYEQVKEPGCTVPGLEESRCSRCQKTETFETEPLGHDWGDWTVIKEPTASETGTEIRVCSRDSSHREERVIPRIIPPVDSVTRIYGATRYETAVKAADAYKARLGLDQFRSVIIACGTNYADALAGSYLSNVKNAPILLVRNTPGEIKLVQDYIKKNLKPGGMIYMLGGDAVVPDAAVSGLSGYSIKRLWGTDRYATNVAILEEAGLSGDEILVASGTGFADSLSASATGKPILLVKNAIQPSQSGYLGSLKGKKFFIIGGTGAVSGDLEKYFSGLGTVTRLGGSTRYDTSVSVANAFFSEPEAAVLAYGANFPDGLCGGSLANAMGGPLLLAATGKEGPAADYTAKKNVKYGAVLGGPTLISDASANAIYRNQLT